MSGEQRVREALARLRRSEVKRAWRPRVEKYGIKWGRLWAPWPRLDLHDWWIGVYAKEPFYEGGRRVRRFYVCPLPCLVFTYEWSTP